MDEVAITDQTESGESRWRRAWLRRTYPLFRGWVLSAFFASGSRRLHQLDRRVGTRFDPVVNRPATGRTRFVESAQTRWRSLLRIGPGLAKAGARLGRYARDISKLGRSAVSRLPDRWRPWPPSKTADWLAAGLAVLLLALAVPGGPQPLPPPRPVRRPLEVFGYFENGGGGMFVPSLPALRRQQHLVDTVAPFWYSVNGDGTIVHPPGP
ncbi:MAG TPA: hypothetical protein DCM14_04985 [Clostridiales bacterium UBA8153]|nr:hypothetical protein [Clostridiales bacterium UBA8153]